jgi:hypothetical protein
MNMPVSRGGRASWPDRGHGYEVVRPHRRPSSGTHSEADPAQDASKLGWNVDLDLPAKRDVRR